MEMPEVEYRVTARNPSTETENRIHSDEIARRYGFQGGLVPGVTVYAYAAHAVLEALGPDWVRHGWCHMRFLQPCYDAEELAVRVRPGGDGVAIEAHVDRRQCVAGEAGIGPTPDVDIPWADCPEPEDRPMASGDVFAPGRVLGSIPYPTDEQTFSAYLATVAEPSHLYAEEQWIHPGMLLQAANRILVANVVMPAWIHVESTIHHRRPVGIGEPLEVRARVAEAFERKGHRFAALDVLWVTGAAEPSPEVLAAARHVAIWQLAG
jgi:acyl dehydratase